MTLWSFCAKLPESHLRVESVADAMLGTVDAQHRCCLSSGAYSQWEFVVDGIDLML